MPWLFVAVDAGAGEVGAKRGLAGIVQHGPGSTNVVEIHAAGRAGGRASLAGHESPACRNLRPNAFVVGLIHAVAGEPSFKRDLARVVDRHRRETNSRKFTPLGVPGAGLPLRATSARLPEPSDQMP